MDATSGPRLSGNSSDFIFYEKPSLININDENVSKYASSQTIQTLIKELQKGPLVALGKIGLSSYAKKPTLIDKVCKKEIYEWDLAAKLKESPEQASIIILGASRQNDVELVYFTVAQDTTKDKKNHIRQYIPSSTDTKIYVVAHITFKDYLFDMYPSTMEADEKQISSMQGMNVNILEQQIALSYIEKLLKMPVQSIHDKGKEKDTFKAIGQEIFDKFKKLNGGNSWKAKGILQRVLESVCMKAPDGKLRFQYIEGAWDNVGDENCRWLVSDVKSLNK